MKGGEIMAIKVKEVFCPKCKRWTGILGDKITIHGAVADNNNFICKYSETPITEKMKTREVERNYPAR